VGRLAAVLVIGFLALAPGSASAALPCKPWEMRTIASGLGSLENVLPDGNGGLLLSGSDAKAILRMTPDGAYAPLISPVNAPGGMRIVNGLLYFNTGDSLASGVRNTADGTIDTFDFATGARATFAKGLVMPNGLAVLPNGDFVTSRDVSGSGTGITRVPASDPAHPQPKWAAVSDSNGMAVDPTGTWLYSVETFSAGANVYRVRISDPKQVEVVASLGNVVPPKGPDDLTIDGSGILYIALNAAGQVARLDPRDKSVCTIASGMLNTSAVKFGAGPGWPETHLFVVGFDGVVRELTPPADQTPVPPGSAPQPQQPAKPAKPKAIRLTAAPKSIRRGRTSCVRFKASVASVTVRFGGRRSQADFGGNARICVKPGRTGTLKAIASKPGYRSGTARVRVRR
jgi:sugar lactone lactonase YvrE